MSFYIIIRGPLGCGKTEVAKKLAGKLKAKYFSIDEVVAKHGLDKDLEVGFISQKSFIGANEILEPEVKDVIQHGTPAIIDGNFYWKSQIEDLIGQLPFPHQVFTLKASLEVCIERDRQRGETYGEDAARVINQKVSEFDYGVVVNAGQSLEKVLQDIIQILAQTGLHSCLAPLKDPILILNVIDDSMINIGMQKGDLILVKEQKEFISGDVVLAKVGNQVVLRRFISQDEPPYTFLKPENPKYRINLFTDDTEMKDKVICVLSDEGWKEVR